MNIRRAVPGDEPGIARVQMSSWETTYRGLFPDALIDAHSYDSRVRLWTEVLQRSRESNYVGSVENAGIVGFISGGPNRELEAYPQFESELYAIYIIQEFQGQGIGRALTERLVRDFVEQNKSSMILWVATGNPASRFYEALGGVKITEEAKEYRGHMIDHIGYGWADCSVILDQK